MAFKFNRQDAFHWSPLSLCHVTRMQHMCRNVFCGTDLAIVRTFWQNGVFLENQDIAYPASKSEYRLKYSVAYLAGTRLSSAHVRAWRVSPGLVRGTPLPDASGSEQPAQPLSSTVHHVDLSKMGYRQAAVLTSVSFFLGMCSAACRRPLLLTCSYLPFFLRGALYLPERRLPDPVHAAHGVCRARWTRILHHVLQLPARYQGEFPCFTSGCASRSLALRSPVRQLRPRPRPRPPMFWTRRGCCIL